MNTMNQTAHLALTAFSYLMPRNSRVTTRQFAHVIEQGCDSPQAKAVAAELNTISGIVHRNYSDVTQYEAMNHQNKFEIAVRNAGWEVCVSDSGKGFRIARVGGGEVIDAVYSTAMEAWEKGAAFLQVDRDPYFYTYKERCWAVLSRLIERDGPGTALHIEFEGLATQYGEIPDHHVWRDLLIGMYNEMPVEIDDCQIHMSEALRQGRVFSLTAPTSRGFCYAVADNWSAAVTALQPFSAMWIVNELGEKAESTLPSAIQINCAAIRPLTGGEHQSLAAANTHSGLKGTLICSDKQSGAEMSMKARFSLLSMGISQTDGDYRFDGSISGEQAAKFDTFEFIADVADYDSHVQVIPLQRSGFVDIHSDAGKKLLTLHQNVRLPLSAFQGASEMLRTRPDDIAIEAKNAGVPTMGKEWTAILVSGEDTLFASDSPRPTAIDAIYYPVKLSGQTLGQVRSAERAVADRENGSGLEL